jgi:hypothetical protein
MEKPQVRQVENQRIESEKEVTGWEAEELLKKYGYSQEYTTRISNNGVSTNNLSFEEMIALEEEKKKSEEIKRNQKINGIKPTTFDASNGYDSNVKWQSDEESGFSFKIEIVTDMNLPK